MLDEYLDLTNPVTDLDGLEIKADGFGCSITDVNGKRYKGFLLAKSPAGEAFTVCDVDFQWSAKDRKYPPRLTFRRTNASLADKAVTKGQHFQRIAFEQGQDGYREFWKMIAFLSKFKELVDIGQFFDRYQVVTDESVVIHLKAKNEAARKAEIAKYVKAAEISDIDMSEILAHRARKEDLEIFQKLLNNESDFRSTYRAQHTDEILGLGDEAVWHHFLSNHKWIFGLSLDLRFIQDFADEVAVGNPDTSNKGNPKSDMLGYSDYTVLVELKTPDTDMFTATKTKDARTNTWSFTNAFIEGFSQCLAQKTDWEKNAETKKVIVEEGGERVELDKGIIRTIDPQVIFIVGNKDREIPKESKSTHVRQKRDTLERFVRNNRNVNIISYDELYRRAYHIVYSEPAPEPVSTPNTKEAPEDYDDIPF